MPIRVRTWMNKIKADISNMQDLRRYASTAHDTLTAPTAIDELCDQGAPLRIRMVHEARHQGATWDEVGKALGISRQAAWDRYRGNITEGPFEAHPPTSGNGTVGK